MRGANISIPARGLNKPAAEINPRLAAARVLLNVVDQGRSLNDELPVALVKVPEAQQAFCKQLIYGSTRYYFALDELLARLLNKPIKAQERLVHMLLAVGLYQLWQLSIADHAAINETVTATRQAGRVWAIKLVNGTLRNFQRQRSALLAQLRRGESFPGWLNKRLRQDYPTHYAAILRHSNTPGPMTLRVNQRQFARVAWQALARQAGMDTTATDLAPYGLNLAEPVPVTRLPGFSEGAVSVQDEAAQLCAQLLDMQPKDRVLDACAAPGGKSGHLLEIAAIRLTAIDISAARLARVADNLSRLGLAAELICADASDLASWWDGQPYDAILLDAPCSGTGVIRRHPDIKLLRKAADIKNLTALQSKLLDQLWLTLKPGGQLLYATCSILPQENAQQAQAFLQRQADAIAEPIAISSELNTPVGLQLLPQARGHDGFYFALFRKSG